ncbi:RNA-binding S4 domain-containing protein [Paratissierella segnis]|mgnify:CR=1 FL=1|jgi:ribosome-associated protein|uniref:RNA-binding S4 domain-containing protein n=1 Tax=Paratissierella segnis TaxID=2763679 RepID=A0A926IDV8_9FIRM|nr:RNA-binding S4 domain-containing protein [Paratissierella segnis]MBC8586707.1 RNA-binding S4 domain-containing protein [Paratissierella segnis]
MKEISISTEYIKLDQFLKLVNVVQTGGHAKIMIADGLIKVNDKKVFERGKKLRKNDIVDIENFDKFIII